jgi:HEAT repeat protein
LLESRCPRSRRGACKALAILKSEQALDGLEFLANEDKDKSVRDEAQRAQEQLQQFFDEYQEITKI